MIATDLIVNLLDSNPALPVLMPKGSPLRNLTLEQAAFALDRANRGVGLGAACDLARQFTALTPAEREDALARERAGVGLADAMNRAAAQSRMGA